MRRPAVKLSGCGMRLAMAKWLSRYGTLTVAVGSLLVAAIALFFSTQTQRTDFEYREALIRPRLNWGTDGTNFVVYLSSAGLGPAALKSFAMRVDGKCVDISAIPKSSWDVETRKMRNTFRDSFMEALESSSPKTKKNFPSEYLSFLTSIPDVGQVLQPKDNFTLFSLSDKSSKEVQQYTRENYGGDGVNNTFARFTRGMRGLGLRVRYCSMTDRFCEESALGDEGC
jgi:hypothetical protein